MSFFPQTSTDAGWNLSHTYATLPGVFFAPAKPMVASKPQLVVFNSELARELGLALGQASEQELAELFGGKVLPSGAQPIAQAYAGHQFGHFTMLGDGRAILLGEQVTPKGERFDIQFKGSGQTAFSRRGDGRAALGPMLREYIISEAMFALGIPTTRSLAVVATGEPVYRESVLPGAILTRVAASHIRVGTFEYAAALASQESTPEILRALADYTIARHYPEIGAREDRYVAFFDAVAERQAQLIARWQCVGFIHGVMNTDNMAISGETIDYGPCAFMDAFDPATVFSSIDHHGRYAFGNQPRIAAWNLARFAETLLSLFADDDEQAIAIGQQAIARFNERFNHHYSLGMQAKLGLVNHEEGDVELVTDLLTLMQQHAADYTNTFRRLGYVALAAAMEIHSLNGRILDPAMEIQRPRPGSSHTAEEFHSQLWKNIAEAGGNQPQLWKSAAKLDAQYPGTVNLFAAMEFHSWGGRWLARLLRQTISPAEAAEKMRLANPAVIPRNHKVEEALAAAVSVGDLSVMESLLGALKNPFVESEANLAYRSPAPETGEPYRTFCGT
ncbi:MAG: YdiU family protein [Turneriella sp.]